MKLALVYTPEEIHPDIIGWLTEGWQGNPKEVIPFLKHLAVLRQGAVLKADGLIVAEEGIVLVPDFQDKVARILSKLPPQYTTCLFSHYVSSWKDIKYIDNTDNQLCNTTDNVHGSFCYWIRMSHLEHLLAMFDQPLRNIPHLKLNPERFSRFGQVCMVCTPLAARLDQENFRTYFSHYGFSEKDKKDILPSILDKDEKEDKNV